jgi:hypothetical protein
LSTFLCSRNYFCINPVNVTFVEETPTLIRQVVSLYDILIIGAGFDANGSFEQGALPDNELRRYGTLNDPNLENCERQGAALLAGKRRGGGQERRSGPCPACNGVAAPEEVSLRAMAAL